jgi:hypothetical protein
MGVTTPSETARNMSSGVTTSAVMVCSRAPLRISAAWAPLRTSVGADYHDAT